MKVLNKQRLSHYNDANFTNKYGYTNIRIPGILSLPDGTVLCCFECRRGGDWSAIDIGIQKSTDGGKTWGEAKIVVSGKGRNTINNPLLIADGNTVYFFYCENYKRLFFCKSDNVGDSFCPPIELTQTVEELTDGMFWSVLAVGPGHGIALNDHSLIIPMWFAYNRNDIFAHHPSLIRVLKRDSQKKWSISEPIGLDILHDPSECCIAQGKDGRIFLNIRNENPIRWRAVSVSDDNGATWSEPVFEKSLPDPVCCAGLCAFEDFFLFTNCNSETERKNLTVKKIDSSGKILGELFLTGDAGYSDICALPGKHTALVAYENNGEIMIAEISV